MKSIGWWYHVAQFNFIFSWGERALVRWWNFWGGIRLLEEGTVAGLLPWPSYSSWTPRPEPPTLRRIVGHTQPLDSFQTSLIGRTIFLICRVNVQQSEEPLGILICKRGHGHVIHSIRRSPESWRNIFGSVNCFHVCDEGLDLLFIEMCHSNGDFGRIPKMAGQRLRPCLSDDRVVLKMAMSRRGALTTERAKNQAWT